MIDRILIVGLGSIGKRHVRLLHEIDPEIEVIVLRHKERQESLVPGINQCVTSIDEALNYNPQAAILSNPASLHIEIAKKLVKKGVHLLIEKPISNSSVGVEELIELCKVNNTILMVGYNLRFLPSLLKFRGLLDNNICGRVYSVRTEVGQHLASWRPDSDYRQNVSANAALGGGVLLELSHEIDYLRWLFAEIDWVNAIQLKQSNLEIDVEDTAHIILGFDHDLGEVPIVATLNMDFIRHDSTRSCTVIGEKGTLRWDGVEGTVKYFEGGKSEWQLLFESQNERDQSFSSELKHFLNCIVTGDAPYITGVDGYVVLKIINAIRKSSLMGSKVYIEKKDDVLEHQIN